MMAELWPHQKVSTQKGQRVLPLNASSAFGRDNRFSRGSRSVDYRGPGAPLKRKVEQMDIEDSKAGQVQSEIQLLESSIQEIDLKVSDLEKRLSPVLRNSEPSDEKETPLASLVPHAESVRVLRFRTEAICRKIGEITNRVEL